jgi:hypothetical protein
VRRPLFTILVRARPFTLSLEGQPCRKCCNINAASGAEGKVLPYQRRLIMKRWEYNFVPYEAATADEVSDFLDAQGQEGWEVVSHTYDYDADGINVTFVLRRELPDEEPAQ